VTALSGLTPQPPADHGGAGSGVDLSASLNPLGPNPGAVAAAQKANLGRYPAPDAGDLRAAAARRHGLSEEAVVPVPGAAFGLWLCAVAILRPGDTCIALGPCFGEYERATRIAGGVYRETNAKPPGFTWDVTALASELAGAPRLCLIANPANPSGGAAAVAGVRRLCQEHPLTTFVLDEAFAAFAPPGTSLLEEGSVPANAIVVRSLTKELALPGLRMGYLVAEPSLARTLSGVLPAWPLSAPSLAAAVAGMEDLDHVESGARLAREHVRRLAETLREAGAEPAPTDANYVLALAPGAHAALAARGITVRDCASFGLPDHVRVAAPTPADLPKVLSAIAEMGGG
jgi:histidinol-phosphate/aromatic aminotransferase/cobyric acid decarboxylase-like protein